ncbi:bacterial low temperature requirement A protein-domain-containing protein [Lipomyces japonicus]|uniref:bacterial low temperature requirement A protein-domain-containing protein n=1 Tax=Lipomyces japonicus TaxID=56871 RepID=UPI0034CE4313
MLNEDLHRQSFERTNSQVEDFVSPDSTTEIGMTHRALFRQPLALQWFEGKTLMKRLEGERQAGRFELFLDLLYVAIVANLADNLVEHVSGVNLVKYILILAPTWHVWSDLRELMNSFYTDDLAQRVLILWIMALLVMYGNNATLVDKDIGAMRSTVGAYIAARFTSMTVHLIYSFASYHHRAQQRLWFCLSFICLCIYIPLFFESISFRSKIAVTSVAIVLEEVVWVFCYSPAAKRLLRANYTTAVDIAHEVDRFAAFFIIVLGEYLYSIVVRSPAAIGFNDRLVRAIWTLIIAFCLNWLYVHNDGSIQGQHPFQHSIYASFLWVVLHLPLIASLLAGGHVAAISTESSELHIGQRWLLCGGIGTGLIILFIISLLHKSEDEPKTLLLPKYARIIFRPISGIIIICLPLADSLHVTSLLSIIMVLHVVCVVWENITSLSKGAKFWEKWKETNYPEITIATENSKT